MGKKKYLSPGIMLLQTGGDPGSDLTPFSDPKHEYGAKENEFDDFEDYDDFAGW